MRSLTKSGIRELNAKYRAILKKCALINMMVMGFGFSKEQSATCSTGILKAKYNF